MAKAPKADAPKVDEVAAHEAAPQTQEVKAKEEAPKTNAKVKKFGKMIIETF